MRSRTLAQGLGLALLALLLFKGLAWGLWHAEFRPDAGACQALAHEGACWGVVRAKGLTLLLGHYPPEEAWRPALAMLMCLAAGLLLWRGAGQPLAGSATALRRDVLVRRLVVAVAAGLVALWLVAGGGPLTPVPSTLWGGLPLTLMLALGSYAGSWPLALALALARRSDRSWLSLPATTLIEGVRGVPLVTLLFMAAFLLPMITPQPDTFSLLQRALCALTLFSAAYLAEVLRAGLQAVPAEQTEAAQVLGLGYWATQQRVVLPQAMRAVLPALTGHAIGLLKDSSLVMVIGLHELTGGLSLALGGDAEWRPFYFEAYLAVGLVYGLMCWGLSLLGRRLERRWVQAGA
jgi:general L-amino acid transport system permease protein